MIRVGFGCPCRFLVHLFGWDPPGPHPFLKLSYHSMWNNWNNEVPRGVQFTNSGTLFFISMIHEFANEKKLFHEPRQILNRPESAKLRVNRQTRHTLSRWQVERRASRWSTSKVAPRQRHLDTNGPQSVDDEVMGRQAVWSNNVRTVG